MSVYKLSSRLWETDPKEFENDIQAWNELRKKLPHKFVTLYKMMYTHVPYVNLEHYIEEYNSKYGPRPIGYCPDDATIIKQGDANIRGFWVPIYDGITDDELTEVNE